MAREAEQRASERTLRDAGAEGFLHRFVADQFAVGVIPVVGRRRFHHREDRFRIADDAAQPRRIEIQRAGEHLAVGRRDNRPHAAGTSARRFEVGCGQPRQVDLRIGGIDRHRRLVGPADGLERRHDVLADPALVGNGSLDLRAFNGA